MMYRLSSDLLKIAYALPVSPLREEAIILLSQADDRAEQASQDLSHESATRSYAVADRLIVQAVKLMAETC